MSGRFEPGDGTGVVVTAGAAGGRLAGGAAGAGAGAGAAGTGRGAGVDATGGTAGGADGRWAPAGTGAA